MLATAKLMAGVLFLASIASAEAPFKSASTGATWQIATPPGWHVIPEGLEEGIMYRLVSSGSQDWQNPWPPPGEAFLMLTFQPKDTKVVGVVSKRKAKEFKSGAERKQIGKYMATKYEMDPYTVAKTSQLIIVYVNDYPVSITVFDGGRADLDDVLASVVDSLKVTP